MSAQELCPICGEGHVTASVQMVEYEYKGHRAGLPSHYQQCDTCTSDFAGMAESKLNKRIVMAFRKQVDGLLTGDEIAALRRQYNLTQAQAARLFGGGPVAFSKYENDDVVQSEAMDTLLRLVLGDEETLRRLIVHRGLQAEFAGLSGGEAHPTTVIKGRYQFGGCEVIPADFGVGTWARRVAKTQPYDSRDDLSDELKWN